MCMPRMDSVGGVEVFTVSVGYYFWLLKTIFFDEMCGARHTWHADRKVCRSILRRNGTFTPNQNMYCLSQDFLL